MKKIPLIFFIVCFLALSCTGGPKATDQELSPAEETTSAAVPEESELVLTSDAPAEESEPEEESQEYITETEYPAAEIPAEPAGEDLIDSELDTEAAEFEQTLTEESLAENEEESSAIMLPEISQAEFAGQSEPEAPQSEVEGAPEQQIVPEQPAAPPSVETAQPPAIVQTPQLAEPVAPAAPVPPAAPPAMPTVPPAMPTPPAASASPESPTPQATASEPPVTAPVPPVAVPEPPAIAEESELQSQRSVSEPPPSPIPLTSGIDEVIVFSRIVRVTVGQLLEIPFRGTGWVYLGEMGGRRGINYSSRRLDPEGQSFIFQVEAAGTYSLKFYKQDFIRDFILNDYVQVIAGNPGESTGTGWFSPPVDRGRVIAEPRWPTSLEEAEIASRGGRTPAPESQPDSPQVSPPVPAEPAASTQRPSLPLSETGISPAPGSAEQILPVPQESVPAAPESPEITATDGAVTDTSPETLLQKAEEEFEAGRVASAISYLDQYKDIYSMETDELLWLYGQYYEANSPSRNILTALDYYRRLVREYPQSSRYNDARRRIAYLERFYINIQ